VKLWQGLSWIGRGWGGLPTVARSSGNEARRRRQRCFQEKKMRGGGRAKEGHSDHASSLNRQCLTVAARHGGRRLCGRGGSRGRRRGGAKG
jgi:hypothetical protein